MFQIVISPPHSEEELNNSNNVALSSTAIQYAESSNFKNIQYKHTQRPTHLNNNILLNPAEPPPNSTQTLSPDNIPSSTLHLDENPKSRKKLTLSIATSSNSHESHESPPITPRS